MLCLAQPTCTRFFTYFIVFQTVHFKCLSMCIGRGVCPFCFFYKKLKLCIESCIFYFELLFGT